MATAPGSEAPEEIQEPGPTLTVHDAWHLADTTCRRLSAAFTAYGATVRAEPIARDYGTHWGFLPTLGNQAVPHSVPLFVEKATGQVLGYGTVPRGSYRDYIGPDPKIKWSGSAPIAIG